MRVAMYLPLAKETGGLFQYARTVLHALARRQGPDLTLLALSPRGTEWGPVCDSLGVTWREVPDLKLGQRIAGKLLRSTGSFTPARRRAISRVTPLGRILQAERVDLCIYSDSEHFAYELATPSLIPIHDLMHRYESRFEENRAFKSPDELLAKICNGARGVLVDSEVGKQQVIESYGPFAAEVFVLPYIPPDYVYDESLLPPDDTLPALLASLPEKFLFYPAQFWEHKNHIRLIEAVMQVAGRQPDIHLVLAGSRKNHYDAVVKRIAELGAESHVTLTGYVSDRAKLALYRRARALVMPTFYGPTNIPPLEAFELGCPVAISGIYGMPAQLGDAALFFDPASVDEIRDAVERLWTDDALCAGLVARGHERARAWGPRQFSERLWEILQVATGR